MAAIVATDSAAQQEELQALSGAWDGEKRVISRYINSDEHNTHRRFKIQLTFLQNMRMVFIITCPVFSSGATF